MAGALPGGSTVWPRQHSSRGAEALSGGSGGRTARSEATEVNGAEVELLSRGPRVMAPQRARKKRRVYSPSPVSEEEERGRSQAAVNAAASARGDLPGAQQNQLPHKDYQSLAVAVLRVKNQDEHNRTRVVRLLMN